MVLQLTNPVGSGLCSGGYCIQQTGGGGQRPPKTKRLVPPKNQPSTRYRTVGERGLSVSVLTMGQQHCPLCGRGFTVSQPQQQRHLGGRSPAHPMREASHGAGAGRCVGRGTCKAPASSCIRMASLMSGDMPMRQSAGTSSKSCAATASRYSAVNASESKRRGSKSAGHARDTLPYTSATRNFSCSSRAWSGDGCPPASAVEGVAPGAPGPEGETEGPPGDEEEPSIWLW